MLKRIINDLLNRLAILYHVGTISLAGFAFMAPMLVPIPDDPTNQAGLHAALGRVHANAPYYVVNMQIA